MKFKTILIALFTLIALGLSAQSNIQGEAFQLTKQCQLCGIAFPEAVVVITKNLPLFTTPGNIGLKFFERTHAIFDFDQSVVYMKGKL